MNGLCIKPGENYIIHLFLAVQQYLTFKPLRITVPKLMKQALRSKIYHDAIAVLKDFYKSTLYNHIKGKSDFLLPLLLSDRSRTRQKKS